MDANLAVPVRDGTDAVAVRLPYARLGTDWRARGRSCTECLALRRA